MSVEVEMLKGPAKGSKRVISDSRAKALASVGFVRVMVPEPAKSARKAPVKAPEPDGGTGHGVETPELGDVSTESESVNISPRTGLPLRQYNRRDLTAEEN